jgi:hypothetical protein
MAANGQRPGFGQVVVTRAEYVEGDEIFGALVAAVDLKQDRADRTSRVSPDGKRLAAGHDDRFTIGQRTQVLQRRAIVELVPGYFSHGRASIGRSQCCRGRRRCKSTGRSGGVVGMRMPRCGIG